MSLPTIYDPWTELRRMKKEMNDLFGDFFEDSENKKTGISVWGPRMPLSDLEDKGEEYLLKTEMPGVDKEDIKIEVDKHSITISAERKGIKEEKKKDYYYCERRYSGYKRSFELPSEIIPDEVEAEYKGGVLEVHMKKAEKPNEKKEIKVK